MNIRFANNDETPDFKCPKCGTGYRELTYEWYDNASKHDKRTCESCGTRFTIEARREWNFYTEIIQPD